MTPLDLKSLECAFTMRAREGFVEAFAAKLVAGAVAEAPRVRLCFAPKPNKDVGALRDGVIDLEIGVPGETGPEVRVQALFRDHFVGVVREGHPLMTKGEVTAARYAACGHVVASRRGSAKGPVDDALSALGLARTVVAVVPTFSAALAVASASNLVALVTHSYVSEVKDQARMRLQCFPLPVRTEPITVSQMWHPRMEADHAHGWLRALVRRVCSEHGASRPPGPGAGLRDRSPKNLR
jgi:DNA-binding transcriptional LysR family regulator